jgi:hypothetical protein
MHCKKKKKSFVEMGTEDSKTGVGNRDLGVNKVSIVSSLCV